MGEGRAPNVPRIFVRYAQSNEQNCTEFDYSRERKCNNPLSVEVKINGIYLSMEVGTGATKYIKPENFIRGKYGCWVIGPSDAKIFIYLKKNIILFIDDSQFGKYDNM